MYSIKIKYWLADILFFLGNKLVIQSALLMGYKDTAEELKKTQAQWIKNEAFKNIEN